MVQFWTFKGQYLKMSLGNLSSKFQHKLYSCIGIGKWPYFCWRSFFDFWPGIDFGWTYCDHNVHFSLFFGAASIIEWSNEISKRFVLEKWLFPLEKKICLDYQWAWFFFNSKRDLAWPSSEAIIATNLGLESWYFKKYRYSRGKKNKHDGNRINLRKQNLTLKCCQYYELVLSRFRPLETSTAQVSIR